MTVTIQANNLYAAGPNVIERLIESLEVGEPVYYEKLTIIPIYTTKVKDHTTYVTMEEAFQKGWLTITELEGGRVPQVRLSNKSKKYIFLMGGEILTGCKQDRIIGRDALIRPQAKNIIVPVYCVEQGRWSHQTREFYSKKNLGTYSLRALAQKASGGAQSSIWDKVTGLNARNRVSSGSQAYQDAYEAPAVRQKIECYERRMQAIPRMYEDTIGVIVGVGGRIVSVDIFANPELFKKFWPKIVKASALTALSSDAGGTITQDDAIDFLRLLHDKEYIEKTAIDLGRELSLVDRYINVNALSYRNVVLHLAAFTEENGKEFFHSSSGGEQRMRVIGR
jgi:hypothetical protein